VKEIGIDDTGRIGIGLVRFLCRHLRGRRSGPIRCRFGRWRRRGAARVIAAEFSKRVGLPDQAGKLGKRIIGGIGW
jgi:hypothetical protein